MARRIAIERGWEEEETPPEPDPPPDGLEYLWGWFVDLAAGRGSGGFGPSALSWQDIAAWVALTGQAPTAWDISVLRRLDSVYLEVTAASGTPSKARAPNDGASNIRDRR